MPSSLTFCRRAGPPRLSPLLAVLLVGVMAFAPRLLRGQKEGADDVSTRDVQPTFKLQVERNLVLVRVVVRDAKGASIENLRKEDFQLFDRNKPQTISHFSLEKPALKAAAKPAENQPEAGGKAAEESPGPPSTGNRFLAIYFDDVHTSFEDMAHARDAADHYLTVSFQAGDRVGVFAASGQKQLDFTSDLSQVHQALFDLRPRPAFGKDTSCGAIPPYEAYLIFSQHDPEALAVAGEEILNCRYNGDTRYLAQAQAEAQGEAAGANSQAETESTAVLRGIESLVRHLTTFPGQRSVVIVSSGFLTETLRYELGEITDRALHGNVILNALDARGLYTPATMSDITQAGIANSTQAGTVGRKSLMLEQSASLESDGMRTLALETGGVFFNNSNDLEAGFRRAAALPDPYYVLGFSPQNLKLDGGFHALKVKLVSEAHLSVQARRGYFAPRKLEDPSVREKEEIQEALFSQDESRELPVEVRTQFFVKNNSEVQLSVLAHLDLHPVHFRKAEERNSDDVAFVTGLFDRDGHLVTVQEKVVQLRLRDASLTALLERGLTLRTHFDIKPGTYLVRTVVRDSESGQISGLNRTVEIPY